MAPPLRPSCHPGPTRRLVLAAVCLPLLPRSGRAADLSATVATVSGPGEAILPEGNAVALVPGLRLAPGARVVTGAGAMVELALDDGSRLNAGQHTEIGLRQGSSSDGALNISGIAVVDRRAARPDSTVFVNSDGFAVLLADARVFLDSVAAPAVFVREGRAMVATGGARIILASGEGVDLPEPAPPEPAPPPPSPPSPPAARPPPRRDDDPDEEPEPMAPPPPAVSPGSPAAPGRPAPVPVPPPHITRWSEDRISAVFASVGLSA